MNLVVLTGRLTREPEVRYSNDMAIARYTLAVDRRCKRDGEPTADFINCVAFGKQGEFAEKYLRKGMKIAVTGRIQTGSYTNKDGHKVYTTDIIVENHEFCESRNGGAENHSDTQKPSMDNDGFMEIPEGSDEELPFD